MQYYNTSTVLSETLYTSFVEYNVHVNVHIHRARSVNVWRTLALR